MFLVLTGAYNEIDALHIWKIEMNNSYREAREGHRSVKSSGWWFSFAQYVPLSSGSVGRMGSTSSPSRTVAAGYIVGAGSPLLVSRKVQILL